MLGVKQDSSGQYGWHTQLCHNVIGTLTKSTIVTGKLGQVWDCSYSRPVTRTLLV
jgi:hypothetical protein